MTEHSAAEVSVLEVKNLDVVYEDVILVLKGLSLTVPDGQVVALLGANGAGKTTLMRAIGNLLAVHRGEITKGTITFDGNRIDGVSADAVVKSGIGQVMEGRRVFAELTVEDNLVAGAYTAARGYTARVDEVLGLFPVLRERRRQTAGYLSGGEQQMLAIARALMANPRLLLLDEPSLGLAPRLIEQIRDLIVTINSNGTSILLVEQNARMALEVANHGYVLENGKIVLDKPADELLEDADIKEFYLGLHQEGRSFRDVKHYRRRKRWLS